MTEERRASLPERLASWSDRRHIISIRSATVGSVVWLTWFVSVESFRFAFESKLPGLEIAAVIAANTAPVAALTAAVFGVYGWMGKKDSTG